MKYKIGDKLVCIKEVVFNGNRNNYPVYEVGGVYEICYHSSFSIYILGKYSNRNNIRNGSGFWFNIKYNDDKYYVSDYFYTLKEYRKKKLEKLSAYEV
jgi:hypothetical protein